MHVARRPFAQANLMLLLTRIQLLPMCFPLPQHPEDAEAPLLVDVTAGGGAQKAGEQQEQQQ